MADILDTAVEDIADLQDKVEVITHQRDFLLGELLVCRKGFDSLGKEVYVWIIDKTCEMLGVKDGKF